MEQFSNSNIITRFAPSPTGYLHLGGARTALFNWIYAKKHKGKFLLRIEDTDKARLNKNALSEIFEGLNWLGINWDGEVIYQSNRIKKYQKIVERLLENDKAYRCYSTIDEIENFKSKLLKQGETSKFISPWREKKPLANLGRDKFVVRLKVPEIGKIVLEDGVQGNVSWRCKDLDDLILLRSDGSATYNLAAVIDDNEFMVTDVIRGDDHLTNTARQKLIYLALGWSIPRFSHIPLIHGFDGKKLSKRHGAVSINSYISDGIKSSALIRYLCQLGVDTGNDELRLVEDIIKDFKIKKIVKSPARFDPIKLNDICGKILRNSDNIIILNEFKYFLKYNNMNELTKEQEVKINSSLSFLKIRAKNFKELYNQASFILIKDKIKIDEECKNLINGFNLKLIKKLSKELTNVNWINDSVNNLIKSFAKKNNVDFKDIAKLIRIAIVGRSNSPGIIDMMIVLGKSETIRRFNILEIDDAVQR